MCLPVVGAALSGASSIFGSISSANAANKAAIADYKYAIAKRDADWKQTLSVWGHKRNDYTNQISSNYDAAGRSYAAEQTRLNETFMQAAFQKQDMLTQLIQGRKVGEMSGNSAAKMDQSMLAAFGRNNATIAENLASARSASMQRNYDTWGQLASANNSAWSEVALKPTETFAPKPPQMQSPNIIGGLLGMAGGVVGALGSGAGNKPDGGNLTPSNQWGGSGASNFKHQLTIPGVNYGGMSSPRFPGNSFNFNSSSWQT